MIGYIFCAENTVTHKKYIGKYLSVKFDKKFIGNDSDVLADAGKYGADKFIVNMLKACETVKECDYMYDEIVKQFHAESDVNYYNCKKAVKSVEVTEDVEQEDKPKKSRKKKAIVEE